MRRVTDLIDLSGRVALVTGGAGHVGEAACQALGELGAQVVVSDLSEKACRERAQEIEERYACETSFVSADLATEAATRSMVQEAASWKGRLDILVHAAAFVGTSNVEEGGWAVPFEEQSLSAWRAAMDVNLSSAFILCQEAASYLSKRGQGSIILISSIYGSVGPDPRLYDNTELEHPAAYGASKGGLEQLGRYLATTLAPNIRVNCIAPGGIRRGHTKEFVERYSSRTPLRRMASEEDMKGAIAYLASDAAAYVTGQTLRVDGGWTAW